MRIAPLLLAIIVALALGASSSSAATTQVTISKAGFSPAAVTVRPGDTVTWTNTDTAAHQVVADHAGFTSSPVLQPGQSYSFTFTTAGKFSYHDGTQRKNKGSVTVSATAPVVTLGASAKQVVYGGGLTLSGSMSPQQTGQKVTVLARECNTTTFVRVGDATTTTGGAWSLVVKPHRLTVYEAKWKNATSSTAAVSVAPRVRLTKLLSPRRFVVRVTGPQSYVGKYVLFQRYSASLSRWLTVKRVVLRRSTAGTAPTLVSSATFRSAIKRGLRVRAFMTRAQAGGCFVAGHSGAVRS
jgi:plastocyanin